METIRQYMESLFINMPNTPQVIKAKQHLLEMAEDKYNSLRDDGVSDNEAVARVIAEFGNLDELKAELGLEQETVNEQQQVNARPITLMDVKDMIHDFALGSFLTGLGVMCFIGCSIPAILTPSPAGAALLFVLIALGVALCIVNGAITSKWNFMNHERCMIDISTADFVKNEYRRGSIGKTIGVVVGVLLIVLCFIPAIFMQNRYSAAVLLFMIALGVCILIVSTSKSKVYERILSINPVNTVGGSYANGSGRTVYDNKVVEVIMSVYWPVVACVYLAVSFLTFAWGFSWIIFVIAAVIHKVLETTVGHKE